MGTMSTAAYLDELDAALVGPARVRRDLVREAADHLEDATSAYIRAGWTRSAAAEQAVADFGAVDEVAPGFQTTVAVSAARRTALILLVALGIQPFLWDSGLELAATSHAAAPSDNWLYSAFDGIVEIGGFVVLLAALGTLAITSVGQRWLRVGRRTARVGAWFALAASMMVPAIGLGLILMSGHVTLTLVALSAALMVLPLALAGASARSTLTAC